MNPKSNRRLISSILPVLLISSLFSLAAAAADQSASGTITALGDNAFSLKADNGATLQFVTDDNTVVEGELKVGAQATVTYRTEDGKNIAVHVQVKA